MKNKNDAIYEKLELIFICFIILMPLIVVALQIDVLSGIYKILLIIYLFAYTTFLFVKALKGEINFKSLFNKNYKKVLWFCFFWVLLSSVINGALDLDLLIYISYFAIIVNALSVKPKHSKALIQLIIATIAICTLLSVVDKYNLFIPSFNSETYPFSGMFVNPNHFGYVVAVGIMLCLGMLLNEKNINIKIIYLLCFLLFSFYMFLNGAFGSLFAILFTFFCYFIYLFVKNKKFPIELVILVLVFLSVGAICEVSPFFSTYRTNEYGFYIECVAVFDNAFNTNLLNLFGIDEVLGADGWDRDALVAAALKSLKENFIFGSGAGTGSKIGPHNEFLILSINFGIFVGVIYFVLSIYNIAKNIKFKKVNSLNIVLTFACIAYFMSGMVGSLTSHSFQYFLICMCLMAKNNKLCYWQN